MHYHIGKFDPSNPFIRTYRDRNIISLVKKINHWKLHNMNAMTNTYLDIYAIEQWLEQNKTDKDKDKNNKN